MRRVLLTFVWVLTAGALQAQDLLPSKLGQMPDAGIAAVAPANTQQTPVLVEYGLTRTERRAYASSGGANLYVVLYHFRDSTGAYGAFTYLREPGMTQADLAEHSAVSSNAALILMGNLLLQAQGPSLAQARADLKALAGDLAKKADRAPYPELEQYLPAGRIASSERFILGPLGLKDFAPNLPADWVGFEASAEMAGARYGSAQQPQTLLLVAYPTPQIAAKRLESLRRWFNVDAQEAVVEGRPVVYARRSRSLLALALGQPAEAAQVLAQRVELRSEVTWNEPTHTLTDRPWGATVYGIFVGTGYIMLFALISGVIFGGFRLLMKKLFPGKVFDRATSVEIIQLGLGSKPIDGKDFY